MDQVLDVKGFAVESVELFNNFEKNGTTLRGQTLRYKLSYTVQKGDNLTTIAKRLNTTVETLAKQNNISEPDKIEAGQKLSYKNEVTEKVKKP